VASPDNTLTITVHVGFQFAGLTIEGKDFIVTTPIPGSGLTNAVTASTLLSQEVVTYIGNVATALTAALEGGDSDSAVQAIADQLTQDAAELTAADATLGVNPVTPADKTAK
jgi:hypothetical protein